MEVQKIITEYLIEHGFDGLSNTDCGCTIDDLMPCDSSCAECQPGHKIFCNICEFYPTSCPHGYDPVDEGNGWCIKAADLE